MLSDILSIYQKDDKYLSRKKDKGIALTAYIKDGVVVKAEPVE